MMVRYRKKACLTDEERFKSSSGYDHSFSDRSLLTASERQHTRKAHGGRQERTEREKFNAETKRLGRKRKSRVQKNEEKDEESGGSREREAWWQLTDG